MTPEERELLNKSVELAEENNKMLHYMRSSMRWSSVARAVYWIFILGSAFGAYYLIQPYTNQIISVYKGAMNNLSSLNDKLQNINK